MNEEELGEIDARYATTHPPQVDDFETAAEFQAAVCEHTSLYDEEDEEPAHWSDYFDSYADFVAAANDPNLGDGTD